MSEDDFWADCFDDDDEEPEQPKELNIFEKALVKYRLIWKEEEIKKEKDKARKTYYYNKKHGRI